MMINSILGGQRLEMKKGRKPLAWWIMMTAAVILFVFGCQNLKLLKEYKMRFSSGDYQWLATQAVDCDSANDTCGQLHLIKGDACFRLAKAETDQAINYACAAAELEKGIMLNKKWDDKAKKLQTHENLCESLRNLQDLQSGPEAEETLEKLAAASNHLSALFPGTYAAVYFSAKTVLRKAQSVLWNNKPMEKIKACQSLAGALKAVKNATLKGRADGGSAWKRYESNYAFLTANLARTIRQLGCQ